MINSELIKSVVLGLRELKDNVVFTGGAFVSLYSTDKASREIRYTDDIDCVIEAVRLSDFNRFEENIRKLGFNNDKSEGAPICRYLFEGAKVDFIPTEGKILGFSNIWYPEGFRNAMKYNLQNGIEIKIFSSVYFLASKLDAFRDRGRKDFRTSIDFEDIVFLLDSRKELVKEIRESEINVREFIINTFKFLSEHPDLEEGIIAVIEVNAGMKRIEKVKEKINEIALII